MKTAQAKTFGLSFNVEVPESIEEFDKLAGRSGACLDEAVQGVLYRGHLNRIRPKFIEKCEAASGVAREVIGKDDKGKDLLEKDGPYFKRITVGAGVPAVNFLPQLEEAAQEVGPLDPSATRSTGPTKEYIEAANGIRAGISAGKKTAEEIVSFFTSQNPSIPSIPLDEEGLPEVEALAIAVRVNRERVIAESNAGLF